jgi:chromosome segregation ATPase
MSSSPSSSSIKSNGTSIADSLKVETSNDSIPPSSSTTTTTTTTTNTPLATKTTTDQASQIIALQATIQRLTKQLQKVKKHKNLAADLLDKRAKEHEDEMKIQEDKYMQLAKIHQKEMKQSNKRCEELSNSNLELSERLKEMDEEMNAAKEVIDMYV